MTRENYASFCISCDPDKMTEANIGMAWNKVSIQIQ